MNFLQTAPTALVTDRVALRDAAVALINANGVFEVDVDAICDRAGLSREVFDLYFRTTADVFADIVQSLLADYGTTVGETLVRRRSLNESIRLAHGALLTVVERRFDDQLALTALRVAEMTRPGIALGGDLTASIQETFLDNSELWLIEVGRLHDTAWELPTRQLSAVVVASLTGLVVDYLARRNSDDSRAMLDVISFDLARRGRRAAKNRSY